MSKTALIVIDFINAIVNPKSKKSVCADSVTQYHTIDKANLAIDFAQKNKLLIIFVNVGFSSNYIECNRRNSIFGKLPEMEILRLGTWDVEFDLRINSKAADAIVTKNRVNCFYNTNLELILKANRIDTLLLSGVSSEMAVISR